MSGLVSRDYNPTVRSVTFPEVSMMFIVGAVRALCAHGFAMSTALPSLTGIDQCSITINHFPSILR